MKRTVFSLLAAFALCVSAAAVGPAVSCPSALLMEKQTGTVLFAQDEHTPREPASVTKIMTLLLVMEAIDSGALGQLTAGPTAAALTHRAKAASRENTVRFMGCTPFYVLCPILCRPPGAYTENCAGRQISPCIARGSLL